jgi:pyruvate kinase
MASTRVLSGARPAAPLLAATTSAEACRRMSLLWGVVPQHVDRAAGSDPHELARRLASRLGLAGAGQRVLAVSPLAADDDQLSISIVSV